MNGKRILMCLMAVALLLWPLAGIAEEMTWPASSILKTERFA